MKLKYKLRLISNYITKNMIQNFIIILLLILGFVMFSLSILYYQTIRFCKTTTDEVLSNHISGTYELWISEDQYLSKEAINFRNDLYEEDSIDAIGDYSYGGNNSSCFRELIDIQKENVLTMDYEQNGDLEILFATKRVMPLCSLGLYQGIPMEDVDESNESHIMVYLGYAYKDIPIGTKYLQKIPGGEELVYEVAGILKEDQRFLSDIYDFNTEVTVDTVKLYDTMDYAVIELSDIPYVNRWFVSIPERNESDAYEAIKKKALEYGIEYKVEKLQTVFDKVDEENKEFISMTKETSFFIIIITMILICSQQIVNFMNRKKDFGILCTQGIGVSDIKAIMIGETCFRLFVAFPAYFLLIRVLVRNIFLGNSQIKLVLNEMLSKYIYKYVVVLAIVIGIISILIPLVLLSKKTPIQLMEGE